MTTATRAAVAPNSGNSEEIANKRGADDDTTLSFGPARPKILLLGDSLTQQSFGRAAGSSSSPLSGGWAATLANVYQRRADVLNRGLAGYNTDFHLRVLPERLDHVVLTIIFFGANDAALPEIDPSHAVSLDQYKRNLRTLVDRSRTAYGNHNILLLTPPPVVSTGLTNIAQNIQGFEEPDTAEVCEMRRGRGYVQ